MSSEKLEQSPPDYVVSSIQPQPRGRSRCLPAGFWFFALGSYTLLIFLIGLCMGISLAYIDVNIDSFKHALDSANLFDYRSNVNMFNSIVASSPNSQVAVSSSFIHSSSADDYVLHERPIASVGILANIGPGGNKASGAAPGVVIASPNTEDPDYLYSWTRDAALVLKVIIDEYSRNNDKSLEILIEDYVQAQKHLQQVPNPSGNITTGGLAEPKFNIDMTAFTGNWGRPQRDGPALRATTLMAYANWHIERSNLSYVKATLWPIIELDLGYVASNWNRTGFDLWEEVSSSSFFTTAMQHRALREGAALASRLNEEDVIDLYQDQANNALCFLQSYWNPDQAYITSNTGGGRSGVDANSVLASIHTFDPAAGCDSLTFQPCSDKALANLKTYIDSFREIYEINHNISSNEAIATGRYPEDVYMGGNPWYLTTSAVAEQLFDSLSVWKSQGYLKITPVSLKFFRQFIPEIGVGTYKSDSDVYRNLSTEIKGYADGFIAVNARYTPQDGALAEQFDRSDGKPTSARDLTWSYAAAITSFLAYDGVLPKSWGAQGLRLQTGSDGHCVPNPWPRTSAKFQLQKDTSFGENVFITGAIDELGNWFLQNAVKLDAANYPTWTVDVDLPAFTRFQYKYILKNENGQVLWEADPNHEITSGGEGQTLVVSDSWHQ